MDAGDGSASALTVKEKIEKIDDCRHIWAFVARAEHVAIAAHRLIVEIRGANDRRAIAHLQ